MPGIRAEATVRRLPDAWADDCPRCGRLRRWISVVVQIRERTITEAITEWCDYCAGNGDDPTKAPTVTPLTEETP